MKVLLTVHRFWPSVGGTEAFVEGLAKSLAKRGHDVTVATSSEPDAPAAQERDGYQIRRFELRRMGKFRFPGRDYRDFVRRPEWEVVNVHGQRVWSSDHIYHVTRKLATPLVFTGHGFYQWHMSRFRAPELVYYHRVLPYAFRRALVIAETEGEKAELVSFGFDAERIRVISSSLTPERFQVPHPGFRAKYGFTPDEPLLLYVGGFYPNKRVDRLVRIAARTGKRVVVLGRDPDPEERNLREARALAEELRAPVSFLGKVPWEDVLGAYQESTLLLLASQFEGYGLVLLEAMASGLPFVATRAGAAPELADLGCGVSVATWEDMAREVDRLVADPAERRAMAEAGRAKVRAFTWDHVVAGYEATYRDAIRERQ